MTTITDTISGTLVELTGDAGKEPAAAIHPTPPLRASHLLLVQELMALLPVVPEFPTFPSAADFEAANTYQRAVAAILDRWHLRFYGEANANASLRLDRALFDGQFSAAIDGNATYEVEHAAEQAIENEVENARPSRYNNALLNAFRPLVEVER